MAGQIAIRTGNLGMVKENIVEYTQVSLDGYPGWRVTAVDVEKETITLEQGARVNVIDYRATDTFTIVYK